jgi:recombination associated protein RdgC
LVLGDECELRDPAETGAVVRCRRQDLETDEVREHLKSGKQVFQLGLVFADRIGFVLGEDLTLRKLRFLDQVQDELGESDHESAVAELDAQFALMTLELEQLLQRIESWFGLPRPKDKA